MSVSYTWKIVSLETAPSEGELTDVVKSVTWRLEATDGVNNTESVSIVRFDGVDPSNFTQFNDLSETQVINWIEQNVDVDAFKSYLQKRLHEIANPPVVSRAPPWLNV
jgi:hypothetical protein